MSVRALALQRFAVGGAVLVAALGLGVAMTLLGSNESVVYWSLFAASAVGAVAAAWSKSRLRADLTTSIDASFRRALFVETEPEYSAQLRKVFASYTLHFDTKEIDADTADYLVRDYDLLIADAALPYSRLLEMKSKFLHGSHRRVFVVVQFQAAYPARPQTTMRPKVVEASGPARLRKEIEEVFALQPA